MASCSYDVRSEPGSTGEAIGRPPVAIFLPTIVECLPDRLKF
jgi:hypothetical protein